MLVKIKELLQKEPGLKAREIARKIGQEKKSVNKILYSHENEFVQDEDYYWSLIESEEIKIEFETNKWMDCSAFEASLKKTGSLFETESDTVIFIVPEKCKILLDASARFLALSNQLVNANKNVTIDFNDCKSTLFYFDRIGFIEHLNKNVTVLPYRPRNSMSSTYRGNSDSLVEFGEVDPEKDNKGLINKLVDCFVHHSGEQYETAASTVFGELIGNIKEHSNSSLYGFAALQKYEPKRKQKHIQTVVSDSGLGIANTLKPSLQKHYPDLYKQFDNQDFDIQLVKAVLTKGQISRHGIGRGLGFKSSREQAMKFDATFSVRQENFSIEIKYINGEIAKIDEQIDLPTIYGTHLCFDFFVD